MALDTFSAFYYGYEIDSSNNTINFDEGGAELTATIDSGSYSLAGMASAVQSALNNAGALAYTVTIDRTSRLVTISAGSNFSILTNTGTSGSVPWALLGFSTASDNTGASTYTGSSASGSEYLNQFILQDYTAPDSFKEYTDAAVNQSASGSVEVITFGLNRFIEMSFKYITNKTGDGHIIKTNSTGVADAQAFFTSITKRGVFEFMPDITDRSTFYVVQLEKLPGNSNATSYKLRELVSQNLPDYYEINNVVLRVVE